MDIKLVAITLFAVLFVTTELHAQSYTQENYLYGRFCNADAWAQYDGQGQFSYGSNSESGYGTYKVQGNNIYLGYSGGGLEVAQVLARGNDGSIHSGILEGVVYKKGQCYQAARSPSEQSGSSGVDSGGYSGYSYSSPSPSGGIGSGEYYSSDPVYIGTPYEY